MVEGERIDKIDFLHLLLLIIYLSSATFVTVITLLGLFHPEYGLSNEVGFIIITILLWIGTIASYKLLRR